MEKLRKTALFPVYEKYGGKVIDFHGWALPVQFEGIIKEHDAVRNAAGLFDVSHMGEVIVKGPGAFDFVQNLITNDLNRAEDNQAIYTMMCYPHGGVVDDLLVYRFAADHFYLVINAGNVEKDVAWIEKNAAGYDVEINNVSEIVSEIAIQGPKAQEILQKLTDKNLDEIGFFRLDRQVVIEKIPCLVSRTGYTGEDGFEIFTANEAAPFIWDKLMEAGRSLGLVPAGLGCRDTLRFEAALPLYGNELGEDITPIEAGLGFFVDAEGDYIGSGILKKQKEEGSPRKTVGFEMKEKAIPRHGYEVQKDGRRIGFVTTGYFSPTLGKNIGLALIEAGEAVMGGEIEVMVRNKPKKAEITGKKFYGKKYKK